ncbi:cytochrome c biogenesis CcdA family protein [Prochlorococcus marinus]|uniref:cytochrome c biogenesis CcdA family protein n=1 Tax=Prochlorococcus marinus TaxID=1219 RepID=UPI0022B5D816|nr:cytochrome c biogenesis CcdA family protein [Prochlorococcus marinus]
MSDLALKSEQLITNGLSSPGPTTIIIIFISGLLTSLGPCSLSLLPVTIAYLAGFQDNKKPSVRSLFFCSGIVLSLVILGSLSGLFGKVYGQIPLKIGLLVPIITICMGMNLLGIFQLQMPIGPDPNWLKEKVPEPLAPIAAGLTFGLAASPCTTPVLAVLLAWMADNGNPITGVFLLAVFGTGQVIPLLIAGTTAATIPKLLSLRSISSWIPLMSGMFFVIIGFLSLFARWI